MNNNFYNAFSKANVNHKILSFLTCFIIISYPSGPFLPDLFLSLSAAYFFYIYSTKKISFFFNNSIYYFFILLFLYLILRSFFVDNYLFSIKSSLFYFRFFLYSLFFFFLFKNFHIFKKLIYFILIVVVTFVVIDTYIQFFFSKDLFGFDHPDSRLSGPFDEELIVGSYLSKMIPFMLALYFSYKDNLNMFHFFLILSSFVLVFLSGERTSFFYFLIFIIVFFIFYQFKHKAKMLFLFLIFSFLLLGAALQKESVKSRMIEATFCTMNINLFNIKCSSNTRDEITTKSKRIMLFSSTHEGHYKSAIKMFKDNFFFGVGPKMFRFNCDKEKYKNRYSCSTHPHNTLLQILSELGFIGFIFYFIAIVYLLKKFYMYVFVNKKVLPNHRFSIIMMYLSFFQTFFFLVPSGQFFNNYLSIMSYIPLGLFFYYVNLYK